MNRIADTARRLAVVGERAAIAPIGLLQPLHLVHDDVFALVAGADDLVRRTALDVSSQPLMEHSCRVIRRMRYGTGSSRGRHDDSGGPST
jgi:hypothetical protein